MKTDPQIYFVGGVAGVGKSSTISFLKVLLPSDEFDIRDFDERGIPDGGGLDWHNGETLHWLDVGEENAKQGKSTVICGFIHPERIRDIHQDRHPEMKLFLLHASEENIKNRLLKRYSDPHQVAELQRAANSTVEDFLINCITFAPTLKSLFEEYGDPIVQTDSKTPEEVANEIGSLILS